MAQILVVDDEVSLLKLLATYLKRCGHNVTCCSSGVEGLRALERNNASYDLAVLDHALPDMDGPELLHGVLHRSPTIRVLISSGSFMDIQHLDIPQGRTVQFLQKPYLPKAMNEAVNLLLKSQS